MWDLLLAGKNYFVSSLTQKFDLTRKSSSHKALLVFPHLFIYIFFEFYLFNSCKDFILSYPYNSCILPSRPFYTYSRWLPPSIHLAFLRPSRCFRISQNTPSTLYCFMVFVIFFHSPASFYFFNFTVRSYTEWLHIEGRG